MSRRNIKITTFEQRLLTGKEQEERKKQELADKEEAEYYRRVFENPDDFFVTEEDRAFWAEDDE